MKRIIALMLAATFVVAACSSSTEETVETYCEDLKGLQTAIQDAGSLTASSTLDEVNASKDAIKDAYDKTVASAGDVDEAVLAEIDAAQKTYEDTVSSIPDDASVSTAFAEVQAAQVAYLTTVEASIAKVSCS